jgi:hypothetical protein
MFVLQNDREDYRVERAVDPFSVRQQRVSEVRFAAIVAESERGWQG